MSAEAATTSGDRGTQLPDHVYEEFTYSPTDYASVVFLGFAGLKVAVWYIIVSASND